MIIETLKYCFHYISCPKYIRKLGLLSDLIGIESRYSRCKQDWKPHLENTKRVILETARGLKQHDSVIIFGAGSLHDVPLKELSELFKAVHLVDIFFLQATINEIKKYSNVEFHELDITGVLKKAYEALEAGSWKLEALQSELDNLSTMLPKHFANDNFDLVISLNLLSQLPMAIKNYIEKLKPLKTPNDQFFDHPYVNLILNHLIYLRSFALKGSRVLVISDTQKQVSKTGSEVLLTESSLEGLEEDIFQDWEFIDEWTWDLAPAGELEKDYALNLRVKVFKV